MDDHGEFPVEQTVRECVEWVMPPRNPGRVAGLWYLLLAVTAPLRLMYIQSVLIRHSDAAATVHNLAQHEWLFRLGIVEELVCAVLLIYMTLAFYRLFEGVDRGLAVQVIVFGGVMPALLNFVSVVWDSGALTIVQGVSFLEVFTPEQRDAMVLLLLRLRDMQTTAAEMLWGVWLFPLALLTYRSGFLPRFLGWWLGANGVAYVALCLVGELRPEFYSRMFLYSQPLLFGEMAFLLWLVIKGARPMTPQDQ